MNLPLIKNKLNDKYWEWNGFNICWNVIGENNTYPIIFIHGFGASSRHWRKNLDYFAKRNYAAYSLDLLGFGNSDQPGIKEIGVLDNEVWSKQIKDFIKQIIKPKNSMKVILIGNSLGALVALTCAASMEDEISTVIASPLPDKIQSLTKKSIKSSFKNINEQFDKSFFYIFSFGNNFIFDK